MKCEMHLLPEGARKVAGGEARLCEREPPVCANHAHRVNDACRRHARSLQPYSAPKTPHKHSYRFPQAVQLTHTTSRSEAPSLAIPKSSFPVRADGQTKTFSLADGGAIKACSEVVERSDTPRSQHLHFFHGTHRVAMPALAVASAPFLPCACVAVTQTSAPPTTFPHPHPPARFTGSSKCSSAKPR
jgi:hypothetical protein